MNDHSDPALRDALRRASLPTAPDTLRDRLHALAEMPPMDDVAGANWSSGHRAAIFIGFVAALTLAAVVLILPIGGAPRPTIALPTMVDGLPVMTVSEALAARAAGNLPDGRAAVRGYWSDGSVGHSCAPPPLGEPVGDLEIRCHDGEYGITERDEPMFVVDMRTGRVTHEAQGPHLTPWIPNELERIEDLVELPIINGQRYPPVPIVVVGHFDDPRAAACAPRARQLCLDRLVIERIVVFDPTVVPTPGVTPTPTPFPELPPDALFGPDRCSGDVEYSFVGWTTTRELEMSYDREGNVYAMVTAEAVLLTEHGWQDDPNGSGHQYQIWGRHICFAEEGREGEMGFASVVGSAFVLWDDGLRVPGENPFRP